MASERPPKLRTPGTSGEAGTSGAEPLTSGMGVNAMAESIKARSSLSTSSSHDLLDPRRQRDIPPAEFEAAFYDAQRSDQPLVEIQ